MKQRKQMASQYIPTAERQKIKETILEHSSLESVRGLWNNFDGNSGF
jgi:hypothetical protein